MGYGNGGTAIQGGVGSMNIGPSTQPERESLISAQMGALHSRTSALHALIGALEARLSAVLMPEMPTPPSNEKVPDLAPVQMAVSLAEANRSLEGAMRRVQSLIDRTEV